MRRLAAQRAPCMTQPSEAVRFLSDPRHYPGRARSLERIETHFAWVFLTARRAYKLKKPTLQGHMNYRTLALRERGCRQELALNRRLAPGVYLRVLPLMRTRTGELTFGAGVRPAEWLVKMRRLKAARMLDRALASSTVNATDIDRVTRRLAAFFARAQRRPLAGRAYLRRLRARTCEVVSDLGAGDLRLRRRLLEHAARAQWRMIERHGHLLAARGARLIDGHGDLRPEHVYLGSPRARACVIDCLEFDADLRRLDPAEEVAFLALECERLGAPAIASQLLERYAARSGDALPQVLWHFYRSQRALMRARIAAWHLRDPSLKARRAHWRARACSYLEDALHYAQCALQEPGDAVRGARPNAQAPGGNGHSLSSGASGLPASILCTA